MKKLLTLGLLSFFLFTSCSRGYYGHIPRVKTKHQTAVVNEPATDTTSAKVENVTTLKVITHTAATVDELIPKPQKMVQEEQPNALALTNDTSLTQSTKLPPMPLKKAPPQDQPPPPQDDSGKLWMFNFLVTMAIIGSIILFPIMFEVVFWYEVYYGFFHVFLGLLFKALAKRLYESQVKEGSFFTRNFKDENGDLTDAGFYMVVLAAFLLLLVIANFIFSVILLAGEFWLDDLIFSLMLVFSAGAIILAWNSFIFYLIKIIDDAT